MAPRGIGVAQEEHVLRRALADVEPFNTAHSVGSIPEVFHLKRRQLGCLLRHVYPSFYDG